jgi:hypothetical protein
MLRYRRHGQAFTEKCLYNTSPIHSNSSHFLRSSLNFHRFSNCPMITPKAITLFLLSIPQLPNPTRHPSFTTKLHTLPVSNCPIPARSLSYQRISSHTVKHVFTSSPPSIYTTEGNHKAINIVTFTVSSLPPACSLFRLATN